MPPFVSALRQPSDGPRAAETLAHSHGASVGLLSAPGSPGGGTERWGGVKIPPRKTAMEAAREGGGGRAGMGSRCARVTPSEPITGRAWGLQSATSSSHPWGVRGRNVKPWNLVSLPEAQGEWFPASPCPGVGEGDGARPRGRACGIPKRGAPGTPVPRRRSHVSQTRPPVDDDVRHRTKDLKRNEGVREWPTAGGHGRHVALREGGPGESPVTRLFPRSHPQAPRHRAATAPAESPGGW